MDAEIERHLDEIKKLFWSDARVTLFVRHGDSGDTRDVIYGEDRRVSDLLAKAFGLKAAE